MVCSYYILHTELSETFWITIILGAGAFTSNNIIDNNNKLSASKCDVKSSLYEMHINRKFELERDDRNINTFKKHLLKFV